MSRTNKEFDVSNEEFNSAKNTAVSLVDDTLINTDELFDNQDLGFIESGIRQLNTIASKSWLLSAILLYTLIYDKGLYSQSGLSWKEYSQQARSRLGMDSRDISEHLSAARFFIQYHNELSQCNFSPLGNYRKLARAELATSLCGDANLTISHLVNDNWDDYKFWYSSFKKKKPSNKPKPKEIKIDNSTVLINGVEAFSISTELPAKDKKIVERYIRQIAGIINRGQRPAIISVNDTQEEKALLKAKTELRKGQK